MYGIFDDFAKDCPILYGIFQKCLTRDYLQVSAPRRVNLFQNFDICHVIVIRNASAGAVKYDKFSGLDSSAQLVNVSVDSRGIRDVGQWFHSDQNCPLCNIGTSFCLTIVTCSNFVLFKKVFQLSSAINAMGVQGQLR